MQMQKGGVNLVYTSKLLFCICCYCICCNNIIFAFDSPPSYANVSRSWKNNLSFYGHTLLYTPGQVNQFNGTIKYPPFGFGFFFNLPSNSFVLAIHIIGSSVWTSSVVVWCANRDHPVRDATLTFTSEGDLVLKDADGVSVWSTNTSGRSVSSIHLKDDGNLVLLNHKQKIVWESFDYPTDTLLYGQTLKKGQRLTSSVSTSNYSSEIFYVTREADDGPDGFHAFVDLNPPQEYAFYSDSDLDWITTSVSFNYTRLDQTGHLNVFTWNQSGESFIGEYTISSYISSGDCGYPTTCGKYGICTNNKGCGCPVGPDGTWDYFKPVNPSNPTLGCSLITPLSCPDTHNLHHLLELKDVTYFESIPWLAVTNVETCKNACLNHCSCKAAFFNYYHNMSFGDCTLTTEVLTLADDSVLNVEYSSVAYIKVQNRLQNVTASTISSNKTSFNRKLIPSVLAGSMVVILITGSVCFYVLVRRRRRRNAKEFDGSLDDIVETVGRFSFESLKLATQDFQTKLGQGGFGSVYEGTLTDGTKVAVKQLNSYGQGRKEFLAEVNTIGSVHHFNLVRLIGFCDDGFNRLLVYEYMCNGSLEKWIFNEDVSQTLAWSIRKKIIDAVAAGLEYLHEHCLQNVIHFDIKPQNILLDKEFNVKISDFGLAKMVDRDQSQVMTVVRGTPGYMAPELITGRAISVKVDVYSFGVLVLEIVCGRRNYGSAEGDCLKILVKEKADEDKLYDLIDEHSEDMQQRKEEVVKMMKIAIWCLQPHFIRPTMSMVMKVLQDHTNMEALSDLNYLTMIQEDAPGEPNYEFSLRPTESLLSGPR